MYELYLIHPDINSLPIKVHCLSESGILHPIKIGYGDISSLSDRTIVVWSEIKFGGHNSSANFSPNFDSN